jgi:predicted Na+-dependent transporter
MNKIKNMKAIAVSQIILIVLGIIVLAVIGYLLYTHAFPYLPNVEKCKSIAIEYCGTCKTAGADITNCKVMLKRENAERCAKLLPGATYDGVSDYFIQDCTKILPS